MAKNLKGKTRDINQPYEVYYLPGWGETRVLKHWKSEDAEKSDPYARVFCAVMTPWTQGGYDMGDVYLREATQGMLVYSQPALDVPPVFNADSEILIGTQYVLEKW